MKNRSKRQRWLLGALGVILLGAVSADAAAQFQDAAAAAHPAYLPVRVPPVTSVQLSRAGATWSAGPTLSSPPSASAPRAAVAEPAAVAAEPAVAEPAAVAAEPAEGTRRTPPAASRSSGGGAPDGPTTFLTLPLITQCLVSREYRRDNPNCMGYVMQRYLTAFPPGQRLLTTRPVLAFAGTAGGGTTPRQAAQWQRSATRVLGLLQGARYQDALSEARSLQAQVSGRVDVSPEFRAQVAKLADFSEGLVHFSLNEQQQASASFARVATRDAVTDDLTLQARVQQGMVEISRAHERQGIALLESALPALHDGGQKASVEMKIGQTLVSLSRATRSEGLQWLERAATDAESPEMQAVTARSLAEVLRADDPERATQLISNAAALCPVNGSCGPDTTQSIEQLRRQWTGS